MKSTYGKSWAANLLMWSDIHKILPGNIFGLILKNKMATMGVFRLSAKSFVGPLEQRALHFEISNLQDMFIITNS